MRTAEKIELKGKGAAYLRVSDDRQDVDTQRRIIREWAERHGVKITKWYEDVGWSRDEYDVRPDWLGMLQAIDRREFSWLVIAAKDRFGTASGRKKVVYYDRLWESGCKLYTTADQLLNEPDLTSTITAVVDGDTEERENRAKSVRALEANKQNAEEGKWTGGPIPFGLEVICHDVQGNEKWRVISEGRQLRIKITPDGLRQSYEGKDNFPARDKGEWLSLRPSSDPSKIKTIVEVFNWYEKEAITGYAIAKRLNLQKRSCPMSVTNRWEPHHVYYILGNPVYCGMPTYNKSNKGKWTAWVEGKRVEHRSPSKKHTRYARDNWIPPLKEVFPPIVPLQQWERVRQKIETREKQKHSPKSGAMWLSGLIYCGGCGKLMYGEDVRGKPTYRCISNIRKIAGCKCRINTLPHVEVENQLRKYLDEAGIVLNEFNVSPAKRKEESEQAERFREAVKVGINAFLAMLKVVGPARIVKSESYDFDELFAPDEMLMRYRSVFGLESPKQRAHLDQLETEHSRIVNTWNELPTQRSKDKARARIEELEAEMHQIEQELTNQADRWGESVAEVGRLKDEWDAAAASVSADSGGREKAEAVRRVLSAIVAHFEPTGLKSPLPSTRLVGLEFLPRNERGRSEGVEMDGSPSQGPDAQSPMVDNEEKACRS